MWSKGTQVFRTDNPAKRGTTSGAVRARGSTEYYSVRWQDGSLDYVAEDQLQAFSAVDLDDPYAVLESGQFGRAENLRRSLTFVHLSGRLANLVYSMGVTNTEFFAHQYKPLLTLLDSPADGLLIADEVGLGKTIEAGIIWTELRAREDMRRLLVVCPAMLREKWREELRHRFGIDAILTDAHTLADEMKHALSSGTSKAWICSYQSLRPPKSWQPAGGAKEKTVSARARLADLFDEQAGDAPLFDLVIFDEAHYMRNPESAAHVLGTLLREVSHFRVLLSATPINLANDDLYHLLRLCDPDHFQFKSSFEEMISANRPLVMARDAALRIGSGADEIMALVNQAGASELLAGSRQIAAIAGSPPTDELLRSPQFRAELAATLERVNLLAHVLTRTRKRDVQIERPRREVRAESVQMTEPERRFYQYVTEATREFAVRKSISDGFLLATPQRQVCSCPAAFARAWLGSSSALADDLATSVLEDGEESGSESELEEISTSLKEFLVTHRPPGLSADELERNDSKLGRLLAVLGEYFGAYPEEKVVLFTAFRATAQYLSESLDRAGMGSMLLWGGMRESKQGLLDEFRDRPELKVLVSTEVASEGVDLQFCRLLVNYDLPWNPMRVEQRIGRIDRLGQKAKVIHIWNIFYRDTIDERILGRLLSRLRIFEEALGEPEPVIGEIIQKLEARLLTAVLTPGQEDAEIERARQALENVRLRQAEFERNAAQMIAHGGLVLERISAARDVARRVTESDLKIYVRDFLAQHAQGHQFVELHDADSFLIQLPVAMATELEQFCRDSGLVGQTLLGNGTARTCRFFNSIAAQSTAVRESIHQFHPLIRFISHKLKSVGEAFYPIVAVAISAALAPAVRAGAYMFAIRRWTFAGIKEEEWLQSAVCRIDDQTLLDDETGDQLVSIARLDGHDWLEAANVIPRQQAADCLDLLETHLEAAYRRTASRKQDENEDRLMFQLHGIDRNLHSRITILRATLDQHAQLGRTGLVRATQGRIDKLQARMDMKREQVRQRERLVHDHHLVCAGLLRVGE
ncbi:SNF2-related protein [Massilia sp. R2A-15]|uniref:SNF2-related protein n=1 Tax=Massilia sp. R2A-15 TaxID=3064278 RepID=UPI002733EAED|nr:SNF2-related protein [Massilia sp. R2A-15]WLI87840.1 SNF2-related protein [Massilia sp. R2A-15]